MDNNQNLLGYQSKQKNPGECVGKSIKDDERVNTSNQKTLQSTEINLGKSLNWATVFASCNEICLLSYMTHECTASKQRRITTGRIRTTYAAGGASAGVDT